MSKTNGARPDRPSAGSRRTDQAQRGPRPAKSPPRSAVRGGTAGLRLAWTRRVGAGLGLVLAVVAVAFAATVLAPRVGPSPSSSSTIAPSVSPGLVARLAPPTLDAPAGPTRAPSIDVRGHLAAALPAGGPYRLRLIVNGRERGDIRLARGDLDFEVPDVALVEGTNTLSASIFGDGSQSAPSESVTIVRDVTAPAIQIGSPKPGSTAYSETLLLSGTSEPSAELTLRNLSNATEASTSAGPTGAFSMSLRLQPGSNSLELESRDLVGNANERSLTIVRAESRAALTLELSRDSYELATLPQTISVVAQVVEPDGTPADGVPVTFSISPFGQTTVTRQQTSKAGVATWQDYPLTRPGAQAGRGWVTVLVTLSDGSTMAASASFIFR